MPTDAINAANAITSAASTDVQKVVSGGSSQGSPSAAVPASALAEANESAATTIREAARGDKQAVAKLAKEKQQAHQQSSQSVPAKEAGKGVFVDKAA